MAIPDVSELDWHPRSPYARVGGYVWLGRMLDKARRVDSGLGEYFVFEASPIDGLALRLWRSSGAEMRAWLAAGLTDEAIAHHLAERLGHDPKAAEAWSDRVTWLAGPFFPMLDADEGRRQPGAVTAMLQGLSQTSFAVVSRLNRLLN